MRDMNVCECCVNFKRLNVTLFGEELYRCVFDLINDGLVGFVKRSRDITIKDMDQGLLRSRKREDYEKQEIPDHCVLKMEQIVVIRNMNDGET